MTNIGANVALFVALFAALIVCLEALRTRTSTGERLAFAPEPLRRSHAVAAAEAEAQPRSGKRARQ